jgi:Bifunctional DNA primase/polymerase, N-terminal
MDKNEVMAKALAFAKRGYAVLPLHGICERDGKLCCTCGDALCTSPGKHPFSRFAPHSVDSATTDRDVIRTWFATHAWLNYGVSTDKFTVIDIDPRNGGAAAWLNWFEKTMIFTPGA